VSGAVEQHFVAGLGVDFDGDLVAHRTGRQEDGRLLAEQLGHHLLEQVDRRVLALLLVAHLGRAHEGAHRGRGPCLRVAVEVNRDRRHRQLLSERRLTEEDTSGVTHRTALHRVS
jgi:hypothetical protein